MRIPVNRYPQLQGLCWNRPADAIVDGPEALALYERNWRFVDVPALTLETLYLFIPLLNQKIITAQQQ